MESDDGEPGVVENAIRTYIRSGPEEGIPKITRWLRGTAEEKKAATDLINRIGQFAYNNTGLGNSLSIEQMPNAREHYYESMRPQWQEALTNPSLVAALIEIVNDSESSSELKANAINALGSMRSNNDEVVSLLYEILINSNRNARPSMRVAAAYALGNIGREHPAIGENILPDLFTIVIDDKSSEVRVVTAYALSEIGIYNYDAPIDINRHRIAYSLIELFNAPSTGEDADSISPEAQKAIILYTLGQFEVDDVRIAQAYANGLQPGNPLAVQAVAAAYARNLSLWNEALADSLLDALEDPNIAVRYGAIESIRQRQNGALRGLNTLESISQGQRDTPEESNPKYIKLFVEALATVFWNEREYSFIRLAAGQALDDELNNPRDQATFESTLQGLGIDPNAQQFVDILTALKNIEELSVNFRNRNSISGGSNAILHVLRSADLITEFDSIISGHILLEILESIRTDVDSLVAGGTVILGSGSQPICRIPGVRRIIPSCR